MIEGQGGRFGGGILRYGGREGGAKSWLRGYAAPEKEWVSKMRKGEKEEEGDVPVNVGGEHVVQPHNNILALPRPVLLVLHLKRNHQNKLMSTPEWDCTP